jgi:hypothetical protein
MRAGGAILSTWAAVALRFRPGCSLYLLTSDQLHALTGAPFACSDNPNATGSPCDTVL